jgi:hypothetical protein
MDYIVMVGLQGFWAWRQPAQGTCRLAQLQLSTLHCTVLVHHLIDNVQHLRSLLLLLLSSALVRCHLVL